MAVNDEPVVRYRTDECGDVCGADTGDAAGHPVDPAAWGWDSPQLRSICAPLRCSIDELRAVPGIEVEVGACESWIPGQRTKATTWGKFRDGGAPPAAVRSSGGTLAYHSRLSEAIGWVATYFAKGTMQSPARIYDFVGGREILVHRRP